MRPKQPPFADIVRILVITTGASLIIKPKKKQRSDKTKADLNEKRDHKDLKNNGIVVIDCSGDN